MTDDSSASSSSERPHEPTVFPLRLQALLFTDIVDSTGIKGRIGTSAYTTSLQRHNQIIEKAIAGFDEAKIIKHTGDGYFALFPNASVAVSCALRFQNELANVQWSAEPIRARVGIHAGEVAMVRMVDRTDVVGTSADLTARVMSLGAGGQILVTQAAADVARPGIGEADVRWARHGFYKLKGIVSLVEIWEAADPHTATLPAPEGSIDPAEADGSKAPRQVGPYHILEKLGEGGMGTVYKAEQRSPVKRTVALKLVKAGMDTAEVLNRFDSERQALSRMDHPNIARVLDAGADSLGRAYFVMEYVPGIRITQFADENKLSIKMRLELFTQVCDAISHAHTKAILHRDITPANVLAYMNGDMPTAKVIDFGIAKAISGDRLTDRTFNTDIGKVIGTYESMSPEQADGSADIDTRTDVYSLGVLLYELLCGSKPFDAKTLSRAADGELRRIIREVDPPRPSTRLSATIECRATADARQAQINTLTRQLRSELEWIPLMAMRKERARRYASPLQMAEDISNYLDGKPLIAGPETRAYHLKKYVGRHRPGIAIVVTFVLLVAASTSIYIHGIRAEQARTLAEKLEAERERRVADQQRAVAELEVAKGLTHEAESAADPNLKKRLFVSSREAFLRLGWSPAYADWGLASVWELAPDPVDAIYAGPAGLLCVAGDSKTEVAATGDANGTIQIWSLYLGRQIRWLTGHQGPVHCVAFSPDGTLVASAGEDKTVRVWQAATGQCLNVLRGHGQSVNAVAFSPDGLRILSAGKDGTVRTWDAKSGSEMHKFNFASGEVRCLTLSPDGSTAVIGAAGTAILFETESGKLVRSWSNQAVGPGNDLDALVFSPSGDRIFAGYMNSQIDWLDVNKGKRNHITRGITSGPVTSLSYNQELLAGGNGGRLFTLAADNSVHLHLDAATGDITGVLSLDHWMLSCSRDGYLRLWNRGLPFERPLGGDLNEATAVNVSPDSRTATICRTGLAMTIWDIAARQPLRTFPDERHCVGACFLPGGQQIVALDNVSPKSQLCFDDLDTGVSTHLPSGHAGEVFALAVSADGSKAATAGADRSVKMWDVATRKSSASWIGHQGPVRALSFSPDGRLLASAGDDKTARIWDVQSGREIWRLSGHTGGVNCVAFSHDGANLLTGSNDRTVKVWSVRNGDENRTLIGAPWVVKCVAFSPDDKQIIAGPKFFNGITVWDADTGDELRTINYSRAASDISTLAADISRDGNWLIAGIGTLGGNDAPPAIWNLARADRLLPLEQELVEARRRLAADPRDATGLKIYGQWYAACDSDAWAASALQEAARRGADVSPILCAQCAWRAASADESKIGLLDQAQREYQHAIKQKEAPEFYLNLCLNAVGAARGKYALSHDELALRTTWDNLNSLEDDRQKLNEAEPSYREQFARCRNLLGDDDPETIAALDELSLLLYRAKKFAEAERLMRELVNERKKSSGERLPLTTQAMSNLALTLGAEGKLAEAEPLLREVLAATLANFGREGWRAITSFENLGGVLRAEGKLSEAEALLRDGLDGRRKYPNPWPDTLPRLSEALENLASLLQQENKLADAEPLYREALGIYSTQFGFSDERSRGVAQHLVEVLDDSGRAQDGKLLRAQYGLSPALSPATTVTSSSTRPMN